MKRIAGGVAGLAALLLLAGCGSSAADSAVSTVAAVSTKASAEPAAGLTTEAPTETTEAPTEKPYAKTIIRKGTGDDVVDLDAGGELSLLTFTCSGCSGNTVLKSDGADSLLVNTIGAYTGRHLLDVEDGSHTTRFEVTADASWEIDVEDWRVLNNDGQKESGTGDDVVWVTKGTKASIANRGEGNFVVRAYCSGGSDLLVNVIGSYDGTKAVEPPCLLAIQSDGSWGLLVR